MRLECDLLQQWQRSLSHLRQTGLSLAPICLNSASFHFSWNQRQPEIQESASQRLPTAAQVHPRHFSTLNSTLEHITRSRSVGLNLRFLEAARLNKHRMMHFINVSQFSLSPIPLPLSSLHSSAGLSLLGRKLKNSSKPLSPQPGCAAAVCP